MGWDAAMFGTLKMPPASFKEWLGRKVDSTQLPEIAKHLSTLEVKGPTVKKTLAELGKFKDEITFIEVDSDPKKGLIEVRSFLSDDEYLDQCAGLAAAWAAAGKDATGELYFTGMLTADFCYRLTMGPKGVALKKLKDGAADKLPLFKKIEARVEGSVDDLD